MQLSTKDIIKQKVLFVCGNIKVERSDIMQLSTKDIIKQKVLDAQENVRDYQEYSKQVDNKEVNKVFKDFAEECACQAQKLQQLLSQCEGK